VDLNLGASSSPGSSTVTVSTRGVRPLRPRGSVMGFLDRRPDLLGWLLAGPVFIVTVGIVIYPILYGFLISLYDVHMLRGGLPQFLAMLEGIVGAKAAGLPAFLGAGNYTRVFSDAQLQRAIVASVILTGISVPLDLAFAMAVALVLNQRFPGRAFVRGVIVLSWATPGVINAILWKLMLRSDGIVNGVLTGLGILQEPQMWLMSTFWAFFWIIIANLWKGSPFAALILLAGMQVVPEELYEAAKIDGAGPWASFRNVTLPHLRYPITLLVILGVIGGLTSFELLYILTGGGPANSTLVMAYYVFNHAIQWDNLGYSSALSFWLSAVVTLFAAVYWWVSSRGDESGL